MAAAITTVHIINKRNEGIFEMFVREFAESSCFVVAGIRRVIDFVMNLSTIVPIYHTWLFLS
jgi:hypothetical protein